ncbi:PRC-barrel domain-containing protein [Paenibacillus sp. YYML68]|uniref:PRC-barrel domain-containing protein n=1 Tax=Paenibacillus sp. YYML68 TaxID=2909250 RepID=UPI002493B461|nr:hypothetical protein [Paenibacillus sp. YYML68]
MSNITLTKSASCDKPVIKIKVKVKCPKKAAKPPVLQKKKYCVSKKKHSCSSTAGTLRQQFMRIINEIRADLRAVWSTFSQYEVRLLHWQGQVQQLQAESAQKNDAINSLTSSIAQLTHAYEELRQELNNQSDEEGAYRSVLTPRIGTTITVDTDAGTITGLLIAVGLNFIQVKEPSGADVFIPFDAINFIS